jgi:hypothetical protein
MATNPLLNTSSNTSEQIDAEELLIEQLPLAFPGGSIPIDGVLTPVTQIVTVLKNVVTAQRKAISLKTQTHLAVVDADTQLAAARAMVRDIGNFAEVSLGRSNPQFAALGFASNKKAVKTPAVKAEAAVRGKATRTARGTRGKNQKKAIHGAPATTPNKPTGGNG